MPIFAPFALVEAFCSKDSGSGNPAGVVLLDHWISDAQMQQIASTVNQAETAFLGPDENGRRIRWFTPSVEVDLCGHATLATAAFLSRMNNEIGKMEFNSRSGILSVSSQGNQFVLDFPARASERVDLSIVSEFVPNAIEAFRNQDDWMVLMPDQKSIEQFVPNFDEIAKMGQRGLALTSKGDSTDFCYRFFAPQAGVPEDHATGSAQTYLVPFWANRLKKLKLSSIQLSSRGGYFDSDLDEDRVKIAGRARILVSGKIELANEN
jgi:predicted PhzF superfamily epimerase YddE/YHI9